MLAFAIHIFGPGYVGLIALSSDFDSLNYSPAVLCLSIWYQDPWLKSLSVCFSIFFLLAFAVYRIMSLRTLCVS